MLDKNSIGYKGIYYGLDQFCDESIQRIANFKGEFVLDGKIISNDGKG